MSTRIRARVERLELRHIEQRCIVVVETASQAAVQRPGVFVVITGVPRQDFCTDLV